MTLLTTRRSTGPRRFSPLGVLEALATPHGVDRYLELVNPMLTVRELRAEVTDVHRSTDDSLRLTLRPTRQWRGFRAGQFVQVSVDIDGVRRTRCYSPACSQYRDDGRIELTVKAHPEGVVSQWLHANARRGLVVGLSQADGTFTLPDERPEQDAHDQRRQRHHPGDVHAAHAVRRGPSRRGRVPALRLRRGSRRLPRRAARAGRGARQRAPRPGLHRAGARADLRGLFHTGHLDEVAPWYTDAATFLCGPSAADEGGARALRRPRHRGPPRRRGLRPVRRPGRPGRRSPAPPRSPAAGRRRTTPATPCSSRPRRPACRRSTDAAWASASPAPRSRRAGARRTSAPVR